MPAMDGVTSGIQLWINLPKRLKQLEPEYQQVDAADIPETKGDGVSRRHIVGPQGKVHLQTPVIYEEVKLDALHDFTFEIPQGYRGLVFMVEGECEFNGKLLSPGFTVFFDQEASLSLSARDDSRFMLCMGTPHGEPIRQYGPFVD